jgi:hypothetical protein
MPSPLAKDPVDDRAAAGARAVAPGNRRRAVLLAAVGVVWLPCGVVALILGQARWLGAVLAVIGALNLVVAGWAWRGAPS